ncbi:MAG: arylsulfatase [Pirellulales bacterium]
MQNHTHPWSIGCYRAVLCSVVGAAWLIFSAHAALAAGDAHKRPNVIVVMTDDQGFGDLGANGNTILRTPHLDGLQRQSATLSQFYVCPVCTPTRAGLLTGRYNYRTRAIDTYRGRAMMDPAEVTLAEILGQAGYATGIFGKWHLGDNYPLRPQDQGFAETLVHRGGGIGQPSDPPGGEGKYTDPILLHNGQLTEHQGYCTDVYFREAMRWADSITSSGQPFFLYLPTNAPHGPYADVPAEPLAYYQDQRIAADRFPQTAGHPTPEQLNHDTLARVYAMIENIDSNVGRLLAWLEERELADNTLLLFLTDNGEATVGYNAGLRGQKATVYEGGIRSPLFARWPARLKAGATSDQISAHIDLLPTILEACAVPLPADLHIDGRSLLPLLTGEVQEVPPRTLFVQSHRGDVPVMLHQFAVRTQRWKLLHASGFGRESLPPGPLKLELYDMQADPFELANVASQHPRVVADLQARYEAWFQDVSQTRPDNYSPPRIQLGTPHENPVILSRQDQRGTPGRPNDCGHFQVKIPQAKTFNLRLLFAPAGQPRVARLRCGAIEAEMPVAAGEKAIQFSQLDLPAGDAAIEATLLLGEREQGVMFIEVEGVE